MAENSWVLEGEIHLIDDDLRAASLIIILIVGVLLVAQPFYAGRVVEPFSELAILGPNQMIGDYPNNLTEGEKFNLYLYVGNHEGQTTFYRVQTKLGNRSSIINENVSLTVEPLIHYDVILSHNQTWLKPITLQINTTGTNLRLIFELWRYRHETDEFQYYNRWNQIWLNITADG